MPLVLVLDLCGVCLDVRGFSLLVLCAHSGCGGKVSLCAAETFGRHRGKRIFVLTRGYVIVMGSNSPHGVR